MPDVFNAGRCAPRPATRLETLTYEEIKFFGASIGM